MIESSAGNGQKRPEAKPAGSAVNEEEPNEILGMKKTVLFASLIVPLLSHAADSR
jgi:hypothetical protein